MKDQRTQKLINILEKIRVAKLGESPDYQRELTILEKKIIDELRRIKASV